MRVTRKRTYSIPDDLDQYIERLVKVGMYGSGSEVVRAGLRALQERDEAVLRWLKEDTAAVSEELEKKPRMAAAGELAERISERYTDEGHARWVMQRILGEAIEKVAATMSAEDWARLRESEAEEED